MLRHGKNVVRNVSYLTLREKDQKELNRNQSESVSITKLFGANFIQIGP